MLDTKIQEKDNFKAILEAQEHRAEGEKKALQDQLGEDTRIRREMGKEVERIKEQSRKEKECLGVILETQKKKAEEEKKALQDQLEEANKKRELGKITVNI